MKRVLIVATTEFLAIVRTKGFLIGILIVPVLIAVMGGLARMRGDGDTEDRRVAVIDRTGVLYDALVTAAAERNGKEGVGRARPFEHSIRLAVILGRLGMAEQYLFPCMIA